MDETSFSERYGFAPSPPEITIRHDAPHDLRGFVVDFAYRSGMDPHALRAIVCRVLMTRPDDQNWTPFPNVDSEVRGLLDDCKWFQVYDIIEAIHAALKQRAQSVVGIPDDLTPHDKFSQAVNILFERKGIGWQLTDGRIEVRGPEAFEATVLPAAKKLEQAGLATASKEIHESLRDLARRPEPDITGAIQHAMAATECVAREASGDLKATLGEVLERYPGLIPRPLDEALKKMWGYASEMGRHLREGRTPAYEEAELAVITAAGVVSYLKKKIPRARGPGI